LARTKGAAQIEAGKGKNSNGGNEKVCHITSGSGKMNELNDTIERLGRGPFIQNNRE